MLYGQGLFGTGLFAGGDGVVPPDPEVAPVDLLAYLPDYLHDYKDFQDLMSAQGEELGWLAHRADDLLAQFYVDTATWGLSRWETELGMTVDPTKPMARRREQIKAKLRGSGTTTRAMIVNAASVFSGGEVEVIEHPEEHRFVVKFVGVLGIPPNMPGFIALLEQIKPAHLAYSLAYTYTTWSDLVAMTWTAAAEQTWAELRTYQGA